MRTADCRNPATESLISKTTVDLNTKLWGSTSLKRELCKVWFCCCCKISAICCIISCNHSTRSYVAIESKPQTLTIMCRFCPHHHAAYICMATFPEDATSCAQEMSRPFPQEDGRDASLITHMCMYSPPPPTCSSTEDKAVWNH